MNIYDNKYFNITSVAYGSLILTGLRSLKELIGVNLFSTLFLFGILILPSYSASANTSSSNQVWHWYGQCSGSRKLGVKIILNKKIIYKVMVPICRQPKADNRPQGEGKALSFHFEANARIFGDDFKSLGVQKIKGTIWQAGRDPRMIILGISFSTKHQVLLNSIHIARPKKKSLSRQEKKLIIETYPLEIKKGEGSNIVVDPGIRTSGVDRMLRPNEGARDGKETIQ